jgi:hypothetical protein
MEFAVSQLELIRRKKAFATLLASLCVGLFLSSKILNYHLSLVAYLSIGVSLFLVGLLTFRFLNSLSQIKILISDGKIERINKKTTETFILSELTRIKIKKRVNGGIREIYLWFGKGKNMFITSFENNFEQIKELILENIGPKVPIKGTKEIIAFDHPLFYSLLGLPISFLGLFLVKLSENLDYSGLKFLQFIFFIYSFAMGIYFVMAKPLSARYNSKNKLSDYIFGGVMICASILIFISWLLY